MSPNRESNRSVATGWAAVRYLLGRGLETAGVLLAVSLALRLLLATAPGDPLVVLQGDPRFRIAIRSAWAGAYDPNLPWWRQWSAGWLAALHGDLGWSLSQQRPVADVLRDAWPWTLLLVVTALAISAGTGLLAGTWLAVHRRRPLARAVDAALRLLAAVPDPWLGLLLLGLFGATWHLLPLHGVCDVRRCGSAASSGWPSDLDALRDRAAHAVLPILTLSLAGLVRFVRLQRTAIRPLLAAPATLAAAARGIPSRRRLRRYVVRRALLPWVTTIGLSLPALAGGAVFVERIFGWPGMGQALLQAVESRDYPLITAVTMLAALFTMVGAIGTDFVARRLDLAGSA